MEALKWTVYKSANRVIGLPKGDLKIHQALESPAASQNYVWIFCSTIGELNGCKPLIQTIASSQPIVLITDRDCYADAFQLNFPAATVVELQGWEGESRQLASAFPPAAMILCEIPILPNDAPCRLSYGFLRHLSKQNVPLFAVNGWLYEYAPSCRQDAIERQLFTREYVQLFDAITVQTDAVKHKLVAAGAQAERVSVTGNMKFDAVKDTAVIPKDDATAALLAQLQQHPGKVIVAGSLAEVWEYELIADSFVDYLKAYPDSVLIMVPRHPEKQSQLDEIQRILSAHELAFEFRSDVTSALKADTQVMVLDTFGELRGMYSVCDFAYIGRNHNVLEPLTFGKPVVILDQWESTYPSYPVYEIALQNALLTELASGEMLTETFVALSQLDAEQQQQRIAGILGGLATALQQNLAIIHSHQT